MNLNEDDAMRLSEKVMDLIMAEYPHITNEEVRRLMWLWIIVQYRLESQQGRTVEETVEDFAFYMNEVIKLAKKDAKKGVKV